MSGNKLFWGFFCYRNCLLPTWRALLVLMLLSISCVFFFTLKIHPFLSTTARVSAKFLIVEGWVPDYVLKATLAEFKEGNYSMLYVVGGPIEQGGFLSNYKTYADLGAATLIAMGMDASKLQSVPALWVQKDRTYASALALKNWLSQKKLHEAEFNLVSKGAHSRRSWILFQEAFGENYQVGIIAVKDRDYDPEQWWKFSSGFRTVLNEYLAYTYVLLIPNFLMRLN